MVAFIESKAGYNLWQIGHYHYEITNSAQPYNVLYDLTDTTFEEAMDMFEHLSTYKV